MHDYSEYEDTSKPVIGDNLMKALISLADRQEGLEADIEDLEAQLEKKKTSLALIADKELPNMLDGVIGNLVLEDGRVIEIFEKVRASIAGKKSAPATKWLDENGFGSIVKREFVINFNKDDEKWADKFERDLAQRKKPLNVKRKRSVHPQTLEAFVREQLGQGVKIPTDLFGIYRQRKSKITR